MELLTEDVIEELWYSKKEIDSFKREVATILIRNAVKKTPTTSSFQQSSNDIATSLTASFHDPELCGLERHSLKRDANKKASSLLDAVYKTMSLIKLRNSNAALLWNVTDLRPGAQTSFSSME